MKNKSKKILLLSLVTLLFLLCGSKVYAARDIIVALDPGHGGTESGAVGGNLVEKDLTWKLATRVKAILDKTPGIKAVLTKTQNETSDRETRAINAQNAGADLLVSFHINSNDSSNNLSGAEVYITHNRTQKRYYEYSYKLGSDILSNLRGVGVKSYSSTPNTRVGADWDKYPDGTVADYYGIISWPMHKGIPAVLIEHAFINNPYDRANYLTDAMITKMAQADANAIIKNKELFRSDYVGTINTNLKSLNYTVSNGKNYIQGYVEIAEWVNGNCNTPSAIPKLTLKSTDGKVSQEMYVSYQSGIRYYFDRAIDNLDINKEYYIEAKLVGANNKASSAQKTQTVKLTNKTLKTNYKGRTLKAINNKIVFSEGPYKGKIDTSLNSTKLIESATGDTYISGYVDIKEVLSSGSRTPRSMPEIWVRSTDGKVNQKAYISYQSGSRYYFDRNIESFDMSKTYYIEAKLTSEDNQETAANKKERLAIGTKQIGTLNGLTVNATNNQFTIKYKGNINTELNEISIIQNAKKQDYITGNINIAEWVDGKCQTPKGTPTMTLKSTDGKYSQKMYVSYKSGISYYFDRNIDGIDKNKEYYIEVKLSNENNIEEASKKVQTAKISAKTISGKTKAGLTAQKVNTNHIKFVDKSLYKGTINTELYKASIIQNAKGRNYISGNINIAEWVNGACKTPQGLPKMTLKSTDGKYSASMYVSYQSGIGYYFDKDIQDIDASKTYYIEVQLTGNKNQASTKEKTQTARWSKTGTIGTCTNGKRLTLSGNNIKITDTSYYKGTINTELYKMNVIKNSKGQQYITGNIYIAEWVGSSCNTPKGTPKMTLKSTDGKYSESMYVSYQSGIGYYFDRNIEGLDTSKTYYIEVKLTGSKNQATVAQKTQNARCSKQGTVGTLKNGTKLVLSGNYIKFQVAKTKSTKQVTTENKNITTNKSNETNEAIKNTTKEEQNTNTKTNITGENKTSEK